MSGFSLPSRPGRELGEPLLDALLDGRSLPPDAPTEFCAVAEMLADLAGPAEPGELAGEAAARLMLARTASPAGLSLAARRSVRRRGSWLPGSVRVGAPLIAAAVGLGGTVAAYADALPGPIQNFAHHVIGAPPHRPPRVTPVPGPGRSGSPGSPAPGAGAPGHGRPRPAGAHRKGPGHGSAAQGKMPPGRAKRVAAGTGHPAHPAHPAGQRVYVPKHAAQPAR